MQFRRNFFHNLIINWIIILANTIACLAVLKNSVWLTLFFLVIIAVCLLTIVKVYCTKCPAKKTACAHVLPGKLTGLFHPKAPGKYTSSEITILIISVLILFAFPQYWLWQNKFLFGLYWFLNISSLIGIKLIMCKRCSNVYCSNCANRLLKS